MSEKDKQIQEDIFSQKIKEKLENHSMPVDESIWQRIEEKLAPPRKKAVPLWYWLSGGVAAAIALLLLVNPFGSNENKPLISDKTAIEKPVETPKMQEIQEIEQATEENPAQFPMEFLNEKSKKAKLGLQKPKRSVLLVTGNAISQKSTTETTEISEVSEPQIITDIISEKEKSASTSEVAQTDKKQSNKQKIDALPDLNDYPEVIAPAKSRKKRPLLLAASMETGGAISKHGMDYAPMYSEYANGPSLVKSDMASRYTSVLDVSDFSNARHLPPLSVGLTLVKTLNETFGIESGLVYTFLKSEYTRPGLTSHKADLNLHYLGVPLNLQMNMLKKPNWKIYLSAGGMIEKGLRSIYRQEIVDGAETISTNIKENIDGVQWSLNSALGIDVKIQKHVSLFAEPKLVYYLDNNQPASARTENPLYFGISGGMRIEL